MRLPAAHGASRRRRAFGLTLAALPLALAAAVAGQRALDSPGGGGIAELSLTGSSGASLDEALRAVTISASRPATGGSPAAEGRFGRGAGGQVAYRATATMAADSVSAGGLLVDQLEATRWLGATIALHNVQGSPSYAFTDPKLTAYLLQGGIEGDEVQITLQAGLAVPVSPASTPLTATSVPPTTLPKPAEQTCVRNPQKVIVPHSAFPLASFEVPTAGTIRQSSPTLATVTVDGQRETVAVFGDEDGWLYVVDAATCQLLPGWPQQLAVPAGQLRKGLAASNRHAVIESTPAIGWPDGTDGPPTIVVGAGSTWDNTGVGEVEAFNISGQELWDFPVQGSPVNANGVFSSPSFGPVVPGTGVDVVFGAWDHYLYVLDAHGNVLARYYNAETIWSSPALYRLPGQDSDDILIGLDKTQTDVIDGCVGGEFADLRYGTIPFGLPGDAGATGAGSTYLAPNLHAAAMAARQGLYVVRESACQGASLTGTATGRGQAIWSSPAIGELAGHLVAAIGTSFYDSPYGPGSDRLYVYPLEPVGGAFLWRPLWEGVAPGPVLGSPAIGAVTVPGSPDPVRAIVDTSFVCPTQPETQLSCQQSHLSAVQAWVPPADPASRLLTRLWMRTLPGGDSLDSPVLVPLQGEQSNDVLVGSGGGMLPLAGGTGAFIDGTGISPPQLAIHSACILFNTPAIADVSGSGPYGGWYAYELCSYGGSASGGGLFAYHLPDPPAGAPGWPMFRGDPSHSAVAWPTLGQPFPPGDPT